MALKRSVTIKRLITIALIKLLLLESACSIDRVARSVSFPLHLSSRLLLFFLEKEPREELVEVGVNGGQFRRGYKF